ncbi:MAG: type II toxin-antitoxin system Phd/YefM family antitoxin [Oscillospiraceae bacterium]|nr:type II toxin-antitoxin system Phd/YefM family antitoxin [Oscillospiraceae bacterium]
MIADNATRVRGNFKEYCDKVYDEHEALLVTRKESKHLVLITLDEYEELKKAAENLDYMLKLNKSIEDAKCGRVVRMTMFETEGDES